MFYFIVSSGDEKPARKSKKPTKFEAQRTIKEGYGQTYNKPMVWGIDGGKYFIRDKLVCKNAYLILYIGKYFSLIEVLKTGVKWQFLCNFVP